MILYVHFQCDCDLTFWNMLFLITEICIRVYMRVNMCVCLYHVCNTLNEIRCRSYLGICISSYSSCLLFVRLFFFFLFLFHNASKLSALKYLSYYTTFHFSTSLHLCMCVRSRSLQFTLLFVGTKVAIILKDGCSIVNGAKYPCF